MDLYPPDTIITRTESFMDKFQGLSIQENRRFGGLETSLQPATHGFEHSSVTLDRKDMPQQGHVFPNSVLSPVTNRKV